MRKIFVKKDGGAKENVTMCESFWRLEGGRP